MTLGLICLMGFSISAQISQGGIPPGFNYTAKTEIAANEVPILFDVEHLILEDTYNQEEFGTPPRFAENIPVDFSMNNSGSWSTLPDGTEIWQLRIKAANAPALILSYNDFYIPQGASLFIYNIDKTQVLGAYTYETHPRGGAFSTRMIAGDDIILEYVVPAGKPELKESGKIHISGVGYCYNHIGVYSDGSKAAAYCMININCPEGDDWQDEKRGIVRISMFMKGGWYNCSGSIVNNTAQDFTPYLLSAYHCYDGANPEDLDVWQFDFNYESPVCENAQPQDVKTMVGCQLRAATPVNGGSDGLLLELNTDIPEEWDVYYNGWNRTSEVVEGGGVGIHHPAGDIKKISTFDNYSTTTWTGQTATGAYDAHWYVIFVETVSGHSVTEEGSSGSALFCSDHLIIGTLTGGNSTCVNVYGGNLYGKFWYHWDQYGDSPETQMKSWLDPLDVGVETLEGSYFNPSHALIFTNTNSLELEGAFGEENPAKSIEVKGYHLTGNIQVEVDGFFVASADGANWSSSLELPADGGELFVKYVPGVIGNHAGTITLSGTGVAKERIVDLFASSCLEIGLETSFPDNGLANSSYRFELEATGSEGPYSYVLAEGNLPEGLTLNNGTIEGTPSEDGFFAFSVLITDKYGCESIVPVTVYIAPSRISVFPYKEDFESTAEASNWRQVMVSGNDAWLFRSQGARYEYKEVTAAQSGEYNALFYGNSYTKPTAQLYSPQLDLQSLSSPTLTFWYMLPSWSGDLDELTVLYKNYTHDEWKTLSVYSTDTRDWTEVTLSLPEPSDEYFIAFQGQSNYGYGIAVDNLTIKNDASDIENITDDGCNVRYTNPVSDRLELKYDGTIQSISIYSSTGRRIIYMNEQNNSGSSFIDVSFLAKGIYLFNVQTDKVQRTFKFIKI